MTKLVDTHAHLNFKAFNADRDEVIERAFDSGLGALINVGSNVSSSRLAVSIAAAHPAGVYASSGIHPVEVSRGKMTDGAVGEVRTLAESKCVVAIGETGLDYYHDEEKRGEQVEVFEQMLDVASSLEMPVIIHCREAFPDLIAILKSWQSSAKHAMRGVVHCFSGSARNASDLLELGFYLSFTGNVTYASNAQISRIVKETSLERIMVETDSPYLAPRSRRGHRNEPANVVEIAKWLATAKAVSLAAVAESTTQNAVDLFGIDV